MIQFTLFGFATGPASEHLSRHVEANLRHDDGLLHVLVPQDVMPHGIGEGPRDVGTDIFRPQGAKTPHDVAF